MSKHTCLYSGAEFESKDGWVKSEDRLPEEHEVVLCFDGIDIFTGTHYGKECGGWVSYSPIGKNDVTHWMTLPTPPKENE